MEQEIALLKSVSRARRQEITNLACITIEMTSASNKRKHIYFTDAKRAVCMSQTDTFTNKLAAISEELWNFILGRAGVESRPVTGVPRGAAL